LTVGFGNTDPVSRMTRLSKAMKLVSKYRTGNNYAITMNVPYVYGWDGSILF
jgi:hypothetical protein